MQEPARPPDDLDALLARKRLSGAEYEFIAERVLAQASRPARLKRLALYAAPLLAAAAALLLTLLPRSEGLRAKGARSREPALELTCESGKPGSCAQGQLLTFRAEDVDAPGFLHAWAEPAAGGERVWYFAGESAVAVEARPGLQLLSSAVRLGPQQPPGRYRVRLVLAPTRLERDALLGPLERGERDVTTWLEVTR